MDAVSVGSFEWSCQVVMIFEVIDLNLNIYEVEFLSMFLKRIFFALSIFVFIAFPQPSMANFNTHYFSSFQSEIEAFYEYDPMKFIEVLVKEKRYEEAKLFSYAIIIASENALLSTGRQLNFAPEYGHVAWLFLIHGQDADALSYFAKSFNLYTKDPYVNKKLKVMQLSQYIKTLLRLRQYSYTEDVLFEFIPDLFEIYPEQEMSSNLLAATGTYALRHGPKAAIFFAKLTLAATEEEIRNKESKFDKNEYRCTILNAVQAYLKGVGRENELDLFKQFSISSAPVYPLSSARPLMRGPEVALYDRFIVVANALNKAGKSGDAKAIEKARAEFVVWMQSVPSALN